MIKITTDSTCDLPAELLTKYDISVTPLGVVMGDHLYQDGVNITTVCRSIMGEVKYMVNQNTGVEVREVNVCVDSITV